MTTLRGVRYHRGEGEKWREGKRGKPFGIDMIECSRDECDTMCINFVVLFISDD